MSKLFGYMIDKDGYKEAIYDVQESDKQYKGYMGKRVLLRKDELGKVYVVTQGILDAVVYFPEPNRDDAITLLTDYCSKWRTQYEENATYFNIALGKLRTERANG